MSHTCTPMFKSYLPLSLIFTTFIAPYFLPSHHPFSYVSTHQQHILPVQITGRGYSGPGTPWSCQRSQTLGIWWHPVTMWYSPIAIVLQSSFFETWFNPDLWYVFYPSCNQQDGHSWNCNEISWNLATSNFAHYYVCTLKILLKSCFGSWYIAACHWHWIACLFWVKPLYQNYGMI